MDPLSTIATAAAVILASGGLEAFGGEAGRATYTAVADRVAAVRSRFLACSDESGQRVLHAAGRRPGDPATVDGLAAALLALARRDEQFRRDLEQLGSRLDATAPGGAVQIAQKISNIGAVRAERDFNLNM